MCLGALEVLQHLVVLGLSALRVLSLQLSFILGLEGILLLCILCLSIFCTLLELFLVLTIPIFFYILANATVWSPSIWFYFWRWCCTGCGCSCSWGSIFMGNLEFVAIMELLVGGISQSFLNSKRFPDIFSVSGQGVLVPTGTFSNGGGLFSNVPSGKGFWPSKFTEALGSVWGGYAVTLLGSGLATTFTLYFFVGINLFLFWLLLNLSLYGNWCWVEGSKLIRL